MTVNFNDSKFKEVSDIKNYQEGGKNYFEEKERKCFNFIASTDSAKKIGNLLVKIKEARRKKSWELSDLTTTIEDLKVEESQRTLAYREIEANADYLVTDTINYLSLRHTFEDEPKLTEQERKKKMGEIDIEVGKAQRDQVGNRTKLRTLYVRRANLVMEKNQEEKLDKNREVLIKILKKDTNLEINDPNGGGNKKLADIKIKINNYSSENVSKKDDDTTISTIGQDIVTTGTHSVSDLVDHAKIFLTSLENYSPYVETKTKESPLLSNLLGDRNWSDKNMVGFSIYSMGVSYIKVLKDIGVKKLKEIVDKVPSLSDDDKKKMKEYTEEITRFTCFTECTSGMEYHKAVEVWTTKYNERENEFHNRLLKQGFNEYPHVNIPNWEHIFEFMKVVFPLKSGTNVLDKRSYLSELKPSSGKQGWEGLTLLGFANDIDSSVKYTGTGNTPSGKYRMISQYARSSHSSVSSILKDQISRKKVAEEIPSGWNFERITQLWWNIFIPYMESTSDVSKNKWHSDVEHDTEWDKKRKKYLDEIRFARTVKAIFKKLGIVDNDSFDEFLLSVSSDVRSGAINKSSWKSSLTNRATIDSEGKVVKYDFERPNYQPIQYESSLDRLSDLTLQRSQRIKTIESEIDALDKIIGSLEKDNIEKQNTIDTLRQQRRLYEQDEEFDGKDLAGKKQMFEDLYNKKNGADRNGKWTYLEIKSLENRLGTIKTEMGDDDAFNDEYSDKETEIKGINDKLNAFYMSSFYEWNLVSKSKGNTLEERIIWFKKDENKTGNTLEELKKAFEKLENEVKLTSQEQGEFDKIKDAIDHPDNYKEKAPSGISKELLTTLFKFDADDKLKTQWTTSFDNKTLSENDIKTIILKDYGPENSTGHGKLLAHLVDKGHGLTGENKADYKSGTEDEKKTSWKKLVEKGPKIVIETIVNHEFEDNKDKEQKEMAEKKDGDEQPLKDDVYKKGDDGKFKDEAIKLYMYEKKIGKSHQHNQKGQDTPDPEKKSEEMGWAKEWFGFGSVWKSSLAYIGIILLVSIVLGAVFWQSITDWWNGPAEEQGAAAEDGEEKDEEDK